MKRVLNAVLILVTFGTSVEALEKWTIEDIVKLKEIRTPVISPDGRYVLYSLGGSVATENREYSDLYVVATDSGVAHRLTDNDARETSVHWAPDSKHVAYLAPDREGRKQVWSIALAGSEPLQLSSEARGVTSFSWSPDGARLLYLVPEPKSASQVAHEKEWGIVISPEEDWPARAALWVLEIEPKRARQLTDGTLLPRSPAWSRDGHAIAFLYQEADTQPLEIYLANADSASLPRAITRSETGVASFAWSPDGKSLAYLVAKEVPPPYANYFRLHIELAPGSIWLLDVATGRSRRLAKQEYAGISALSWSHDGSRLAFLAKPPGTQDKYVATGAMYVVPIAGGEEKRVASGLDIYRDGIGLTWSRDSREVWLTNGDRMGYNVFAVDAASGGVRNVTTGQDSISSVSYSEDFGSAAFVSENVNLKPDVYVTALPRWEPRRLTDINPEVRRFAPWSGEIIRYASEGREIEALLIKPPDFDRSRKYPLLLIIHGGPAWYKKNDWRAEWEQHPIAAYASEGYCMVFPNVRGSADYGSEFRRANFHDLGGGDARDALAAVDYLIGQGFIDPEKLGIAGWSYGGFLTPAIITQTDRFKAAQFGAGLPSLEAMYSRLSTVELVIHDNYGKRPWEDPQMHIQYSPLYAAGKVKTPTLIEHGEEDPRCPVGGAVLFYKALKFYGVPVVLEIYPKEGHGITGPLLHRRCIRRNLEWFNKWLMGDRSTSFEKPFPSPPTRAGN